MFTRVNGVWQFTGFLDEGFKKKKDTAKTGKDAFSGKNIYFEHPLESDVHMKETETKHMNYINCQKRFVGNDKRTDIISTSDPNGFIHFWDVKKY